MLGLMATGSIDPACAVGLVNVFEPHRRDLLGTHSGQLLDADHGSYRRLNVWESRLDDFRGHWDDRWLLSRSPPV